MTCTVASASTVTTRSASESERQSASERRSAKLRTCRSEDAHRGGGACYSESNYPVQELGRKRRGGRIFEGGVLAGHYGTCT